MSYNEFLNLISNGFTLFFNTLSSWADVLMSNYFFITLLGFVLFSSFIFLLLDILNIPFKFHKLNLDEAGGYISIPSPPPVSSSDNNVVSNNVISDYTPLMDVPPPEPEPRVYSSKSDPVTGKITLITDENLNLITPTDPPEPVYTPQMEVVPPPGKDDPYEYREFDDYYHDSDYYEYRDNIDMLDGDFGNYD